MKGEKMVDGGTKTVVAVDLGASNGRVFLGRLRRGILQIEEVFRFKNEILHIRGEQHWNWPSLRDSAKAGVDKAIGISSPASVLSISCDSWGVDYGLLDESNRLVDLPFSYRDHRLDGVSDIIAGILPSSELRKKIGSVLNPISTLCQLKAEKNPGGRKLLFMADLVHQYLCGEYAADWTMGTLSQLMNVNTGSWDYELLAKLGITAPELPVLYKIPTFIGEYRGAKVSVTAGHDTAAAATLVPPSAIRTAFVSVGTWIMTGVRIDSPANIADRNIEELLLLGLPNNTWGLFKGGCGMWLIHECVRIWRTQGVEVANNELVAMAESSDIQTVIDINDPRFFAPDDMIAEIVDYCENRGMTVPRSPSDFIKVILDSVALACADALVLLSSITGNQLENVRLVGGGGRNSYFCAKLAERTGLTVVAGPAEGTIYGNMLLQYQALGVLGEEDFPAVIERSVTTKEY